MARRKILKAQDRRELLDIPADEDSLIRHYSLQIEERERELSTKHEEDAARIATLREAATVMDDEEAKVDLLERDEAWAHHLSVLDRETARRFESRMRKTDAVAGARFNGAKELEELRSPTAALAVTVMGNGPEIAQVVVVQGRYHSILTNDIA